MGTVILRKSRLPQVNKIKLIRAELGFGLGLSDVKASIFDDHVKTLSPEHQEKSTLVIFVLEISQGISCHLLLQTCLN